jgi:uncharacterized protein (DUF3820 family)
MQEIEELKCKCGSIDIRTEPVVFRDGTKHHKAICNVCNRYIKFVGSEGNPTVMVFGKYQGLKICELPTDYLKWGAKNVKGKYGKAITEELNKRGYNIFS